MIFDNDVCDEEPSAVVCGCGRLCHYALNTDRYVCPVHGAVVTSECAEQGAPGVN